MVHFSQVPIKNVHHGHFLLTLFHILSLPHIKESFILFSICGNSENPGLFPSTEWSSSKFFFFFLKHFIKPKLLSMKIHYEHCYVAFYQESSNFWRVSLSDTGHTQGTCYFSPYYSLPIFLLAKNSICQHLLNPGDVCMDSPEGNHSLSPGTSERSWSIINDKNVITISNTEEYLFGIACEIISYAMICIMLQSGNSYVILLINCELMNDK